MVQSMCYGEKQESNSRVLITFNQGDLETWDFLCSICSNGILEF